MKSNIFNLLAVVFIVLLLGGAPATRPTQAQELGPLSGNVIQGTVLGTAFTYQGRLSNTSGDPVSGPCILRFTLYQSAANNDPVGTPQTANGVMPDNGYFTVALDFGATAFNGEGRFLKIEVDCGSGSFTALDPRVELTSAPYALYAVSTGALRGNPVSDSAPSAGDVLQWNGSSWMPASGGTGNAWSLTGNSGLTPGTNFLGTTDNQALQLHVNGACALRLEPNATSPNVIGGYSGNSVSAGVYGAAIGGGGASGSANRVTDDYSTVGGGLSNRAGDNAGTTSDSPYATVSGGWGNTASSDVATIGGGWDNVASGTAATVAGGSSNAANGAGAFVGGGGTDGATIAGNQATGNAATVGGGLGNAAIGGAATIGGGKGNTISAISPYATIGGGWNNTASSGQATVGGGWNNIAGGQNATIGGGLGNTASGSAATIGGGNSNAASGGAVTVGGGSGNIASGLYATVPGGQYAQASFYGQMAYASGQFASAGDAQASLYVMRTTTNSAGTWEDLYLDGSSALLTIADGRTLTFDILVVGRSNDGESAGYYIWGVAENIGGTTTVWATTMIVHEDDATWDAQAVADDAVDALVMQVMGNGEIIRWVATVRTTEVAW